jgi:hypothetical protein
MFFMMAARITFQSVSGKRSRLMLGALNILGLVRSASWSVGRFQKDTLREITAPANLSGLWDFR